MPCDTISTIKVNLANADASTLKAAMLGLGLTEGQFTYNKTSWQVTVYGGSVGRAEIVKAYGEAALMTQAKRFGWSVKRQPDGKLLVQKASF